MGRDGTVVMGLYGHPGGHDPAAALFVQGELVAASEEERFVRLRHAPGYPPHQSMEWCLAYAGLGAHDVDHVAVGWNPSKDSRPHRGDELRSFFAPMERLAGLRSAQWWWVDHHVAHASLAYWTAPFRTCAVLVSDGVGERSSGGVFLAEGGAISELWTVPFRTSIGLAFEACSTVLGFGQFGAGKVMGLAAWGQPRFQPDIEAALGGLPLDARPERIRRAWVAILTDAVSGVRRPGSVDAESLHTTPYADLCASVQALGVSSLTRLAESARHEAGVDELAVAGGVALNCLAMAALEAGGPVHVPPAAGDSGCAVGAGAMVSNAVGSVPSIPFGRAAFGPEASSRGVSEFAAQTGLSITGCRPSLTVPELVAQGLVVGRYAGRAEFGPRALGNRSIFCLANSEDARDGLNRRKRREPWRPFGLAMSDSVARTVLGSDEPLPFMAKSRVVRADERKSHAGGVHVDGTTRPQVTCLADGTPLGEMLRCLDDEHGVDAVINTSLNVRAPIAGQASDALKVLTEGAIDVLVVGDEIILSRNPLASRC